MSTRSRPTSAAADGPGTPVRRDGCIGRDSSGFSDFVCGERRSSSTLRAEVWPGFEIVFQYHSSRYEITVENPNGVSHGVARITLDGKALARTPGANRVSPTTASRTVRGLYLADCG